MADTVEVAIERALLDRAISFAAAQSPVLPLALPNVAFPPPAVGQNAKWLRATFLPADSFELGIAFDSSNQHYGLLQIDVFHGQGAGEIALARIAAAIIAYFPRGTECTKGGFTARVVRQPYRGQMLKDDPWVMIPVRIPYLAFA